MKPYTVQRHREPHTCQREGPWAACDANRLLPVVKAAWDLQLALDDRGRPFGQLGVSKARDALRVALDGLDPL